MSTDILELMKNKDNFKENKSQFYLIYMNDFYNITEGLNLNISKKKLEEMITDVKYLDFIYYYIKVRVFYLYYTNNEKEFDDFI